MGGTPKSSIFLGVHFRKPSSQFYSAACGWRFGIQDLPVCSAGNCHRLGITMCTVYICIYNIYIYQIYIYMYIYIYYYILYNVFSDFGKTIQVQIQPQPTSPARTDLRRRLRWLAMLAVLMLDWFYWVHRDSMGLRQWLIIFPIKPAKQSSISH